MSTDSQIALGAAESAAASAALAATAADYAAEQVAAFAGVGTVANQLADRIDGDVDHGEVSGTVAIDPNVGTHILEATGPTVLNLGTPAGLRFVSVYVVSGADDVTVDGITGLELADATFATFAYVRGAWIVAAAGGGGGGTPDATPPSDITDLGATGGEGTGTLTGTNPTDAESTARIKYRYWLTSGGGTGAYATANSFPIDLPDDIPAGDYTAQAYSFSSGGQQNVPDSATFTVTAPLVPILDTFTMSDGNLAGHVPDSGTAAAWSNGSGMGYQPGDKVAPAVAGNKITMTGDTSHTAKLPIAHTNGGTTVYEFDYVLTGTKTVMFAFGDVDNYFYGYVNSAGEAVLYHFNSFTQYVNATAQPASGRVSLTYAGNAITLKINGSTIGTGTRLMTLVAPHVALGSYGGSGTGTVDNLSVTSS